MAKFKAANVPAQLKDTASWLVWKYKKNVDPAKKPLKVPYYVNGRKRIGAIGTRADRQKLSSFTKAQEVWLSGEYDGLGFAVFPDQELTFIDLDDCIGSDGEISDFGQELIATGTYVEVSPSGQGLRALYTGGALIQGKKNGHIEAGDRVEVYCGSAYVTITGDVVGGVVNKPIELPARLKRKLSPVIEGATGSTSVATSDEHGALVHPDAAPLPEFTADHARHVLAKLPKKWGSPGEGTWYRVAAALHLQFDGAEEAYDVLDEWSQGLEGYDERANRARWAAGFSHAKAGVTTMKNLVFEGIKNGTLSVKKGTMEKWRLSRPVDKDFEDADEVIAVGGPGLPEHSDLIEKLRIKNKIETEPEPVDWLVKNFIARKNVTILAGGSGTSKSYMAMQMCSYGAVGLSDFGGMALREGGFRTLYLAYEDADSVMHTRIHMLKRALLQRLGGQSDFDEDDELDDAEDVAEGRGYEEPDYDYSFVEQWNENFLLATSEELDTGAWILLKKSDKFDVARKTELHEYLIKFITDYSIDLLVFDTASEIHEVEENSTTDMVALMRLCRQITTAANCAVLVVQHIQKGSIVNSLDDINQANVRGSSAFVDKARNVMMLARMPKADAPKYGLPATDHTHENIIAMKHVKANLGEYNPLSFFERTSTGVLAHHPDIKLLDMAPIDDSKDQATAERNIVKAQQDRQNVLGLITKENENGNNPSAVWLRTQANGQFGISDHRIRSAISFLTFSNEIEEVVDDNDHRVKGYKLVD